ncbi:PP-loop family-domain-containing protein, partial [Schizophyllum commune]
MPPSKSVLPISKDEFAQYIRACLPRTKRRAIGASCPPPILCVLSSPSVVANSGGPDSTCLLFLLQRWARSLSKSHFHRILSCSVDHNLQPSSAQWMSHTARFAARLNVDHRSARVTWGDGRYPPKPTSGAKGKLELAAREARYALLHEVMCSAGADVAAFGHHADDQVETAILRALKGSSELGLAGMKPCRRFGMGSRGELGHEGLRRWIVRPLLPVSKDRILATCDEHKLEYVVDSTNFQPDLTLRNAIRKAVEERNVVPVYISGSIERFDPSLTKSAIEDRLSGLDIPLDISQGAPALRHAAQQLSRRAQRVEEATTIALKARSLTSPAGALTLFAERLRRISDLAVMKGDNILPLVQRNLITRVLRHASPHPWGALQAEANRQTQSLERIRAALFGPDATSLPQDSSQALPSPAPFSAGADVLWTP